MRWLVALAVGLVVLSGGIAAARGLDVSPGTAQVLDQALHAPAAPTPLSAEVTGDDSDPAVQLSWVASAGAVSYDVWRAPKGGGSLALLVTTGSTDYLDTSVSAGAAYDYRVYARAGDGMTSRTPAIASASIPAAAPLVEEEDEAE